MKTTINYKGHKLLSACVPTAEKIFPYGIARKSAAGKMISATAQRWLNAAIWGEMEELHLELFLESIFKRAQGFVSNEDATALGKSLTHSEIRSLVAFAIRRGALNFSIARDYNENERQTFAAWALLYYSARVADRALSNGIYKTEATQIAAHSAHPENYANDKRGIAGALLGDRNLAAGCAR